MIKYYNAVIPPVFQPKALVRCKQAGISCADTSGFSARFGSCWFPSRTQRVGSFMPSKASGARLGPQCGRSVWSGVWSCEEKPERDNSNDTNIFKTREVVHLLLDHHVSKRDGTRSAQYPAFPLKTS